MDLRQYEHEGRAQHLLSWYGQRFGHTKAFMLNLAPAPCSPQQFITGFPRTTVGFHHFHFFYLRQCVLVSFQYASSAPICFHHHSRCTTPSTITFPPLFSFSFYIALLHCGCSITKMEGHVGLHAPMQPTTCIPLCIHATAFILYKHFSQPLAIMASGVQQVMGPALLERSRSETGSRLGCFGPSPTTLTQGSSFSGIPSKCRSDLRTS